MRVGKLLLLVALGSLWSGCSYCFPTGCKIQKLDPPTPATTFKCSFLGLTAIPDDIPPNVDRVELTYNAIRAVTSLPPLPQVHALDLNFNSIESFAWESLCNLPALEVLYLHNNRLQHVKLDTVIEYLPKLRNVYLADNKLVSCSLYEIGWPQMTSVSMHDNPAPCDCFLDHGLTGKPCVERGVDAHCSLCSACFFLSGQKREDLYCKSPDKAKQLPSSNASTHLAKCDRRQSMTTRATTTKVGTLIPGEAQRTLRSSETDTSQTTRGELKPLLPTTRATTTATSSVIMDADEAKTSNLQTSEKDALLHEGSYHGTTPTTKASYNKHSQAAITSNATQDDQELPIGHISIVVLEIALTLMAIICFARLFLMRNGTGCSRRKDVNRDQPIPLHHISPPMASSAVSSTHEGGVDPGQLAVPNNGQHCVASGHNAVPNNVQHHMSGHNAVPKNDQYRMASGHNAVPNNDQQCMVSGHNAVPNNDQQCMASGHNAVPNNVQHRMAPTYNAAQDNDQHRMAPAYNAVQDNDQHRMAPAYNAVPNNDPQCMAPTYNTVPNNDQQCMAPAYNAVHDNDQHRMAPAYNAVPNNDPQCMAPTYNTVPNNDQQCMAPAYNAVHDNDQHRMAPAYNAVPNNDPQCMAPTYNAVPNNDQQCMASAYNAVPNDDQQCMGSEYERPFARAVPCRLYAPPDVNSANNSTYARET
ncbi:IGSF10 [Branchiostoma lanceolatum]|uniref:IGSF10 protein n=1 Tax=Branchiostoma lanceolatum TaxID=7740 RepID=A0A8J9Z6A1_BRALA|nr:IGSF10 [Branchiostoma lanceolatum]